MATRRARRKSRLQSERRRKKLPAASHQLKTTGGWQWAWPAAPLAPGHSQSPAPAPTTVLHGEPAAGSTGHSSTGWGPSPSARRLGIGRRKECRQEIPPQDEKQRRRAGRQGSTSPSGCHETLWQSIKVAVKVESGVGARRRDQAFPQESRWKRSFRSAESLRRFIWFAGYDDICQREIHQNEQ